MATYTLQSLDSSEFLISEKQDFISILDQVTRAERKNFPRNEILDFDTELKKRNAELIVVLEPVRGASSTPPVVAAYAVYVSASQLELLHKLCVCEKYRRQGIARKMLLSHHERLAARGCSKVQLWVDQARVPARSLYKDLGFEEVGRVENYYGPDRTALRMQSEIFVLCDIVAWPAQKMHQGSILFAALLAIPRIIVAAPSIGLPINAQVPPVARVSQTFNFAFASTTFTSSAGDLSYSTANAPGWLQLDRTSRIFLGTPASSDVGAVKFDLVASDSTGSTTMPVTLVVASSTGPGLGKPIADQLSTQSGYQSPDTLLLHHSSALSVSFSPDTFIDTDHDTVYYSICANNTPLPSWIAFDPGSLSFSGKAPQNTSPDELPQTFDIHLIASDVVGFSAAVASFSIVLENHILTFGNQPQLINITNGVPFLYNGVRPSLTLDDHPVDPALVREIHADTPDWVSFDQNSWVLSGTPAGMTDTQHITVTATDVYGENASTTLILQLAMNTTTNLLGGPLGIVTATAGTEFEYAFNMSVAGSSETKLSVDLGAASPWLQFDDSVLELSGLIPSDLKSQDIILNVTASRGSTRQSELLTISIEASAYSSNSRSADIPTSSLSSQSAASSPTSMASFPSSTDTQDVRSQKARLAAAIAVPVVVVFLFLAFACCFICRRRRREKTWLCVSKRKISRPFTLDETSDRESIGAMIEKPAAARNSAPSQPPVTDFPGFRSSMASKRRSLFRLSKGPTDDTPKAPTTDSWDEYTQGLDIGRPKTAAQPQFALVPEEQASSRREGSRISSRRQPSRSFRRSADGRISPSKRLQQKQRMSEMSFGSLGFRSSQRRSGVGHGRNGSSLGTSCWGFYPGIGMGHGNGGPPDVGRQGYFRRNQSRGSWNTTNSTIKTSDPSSSEHNEDERSHAILSAARSFPRPPTSGTLEYKFPSHTIPETEDERRSTIRAVAPEGPQTYALPLERFHKRRARNRHDRNTFFAANHSRRGSPHQHWMNTISSPIFSSTPSMSSFRARRPSRPPSTRSPPRPSPPKSRPSSHGLAEMIATGITHHLDGSRGSLASSLRLASAVEDSEPGTSPEIELGEERDEEGHRRWRPADASSREIPTTSGAREGEGRDKGWSGLESIISGTEGVRQHLQRLSFLRQQGSGGGRSRESGKKRFVVGSRARRPVSVDNGSVARGPSMRGDVVDERELAFL
ncbi:MAG: hypothetical protein Q9177_005468 [Variospora cf. flavescens]